MDDAEVARVGTAIGAHVELERRATSGSSNVTWLVRLDGVPAVLRHPPRRADRLPTAHDLVREARILRAIASTTVPVPRVVTIVEDLSVLGVPFVVTSRCRGTCLLDEIPDALYSVSLAHAAIDVLADIHTIDPDATGIHTPAGSYLTRQIDRWHDQLRRTSTASRLGDLASIVAWLHASRPSREERTLVHGDYGFHNLLVSAAHVEAVLDWELATLGDPVADLYSFLKSWGPDADAPNAANDVIARAPGAPAREAMLDRYARRTGRDVHESRLFYEAFGLWRSIGILEGIHARTGGERFAEDTPRLVARVQAMMQATGPTR